MDDLLVGLAVGAVSTLLLLGSCGQLPVETKAKAVTEVCGPCDHAAECGPFECVAGVEGWHKKAGAR